MLAILNFFFVMRTRIVLIDTFILMLMFAFNTKAQTDYQQILGEGYTFSTPMTDLSGQHILDYSIEDYDGTYYNVLYDNYYCGKIRATDDNSKLYFIPKDSVSEILIMDLNLEVGDVFEQHFIGYSSSQSFYLYTEEVTVTSVFEKYGRKHVEFDYELLPRDILDTVPIKLTFIEGIGPNYGLEECPTGTIVICKQEYSSNVYMIETAYIVDCFYRYPIIGDYLEEMENENYRVFPTITDDIVNINYDGECADIKLFDVYGRIITEYLHTNLHNIHLGTLSQGIYIIGISIGENIYYQKIIKR